MIYKVTMMSGQEVILESEEAVKNLLEQANSGKKLVVTKHGIVNVASIDSITKHKERMTEYNELLRLGKKSEEAHSDMFGNGIFKNLLGGNKQLQNQGGKDSV